MNDTAIIAMFFTMVAIMMAWFVIGSKGKWPLKAFVIIVVPIVCVLSWLSLGALMGWPVQEIPTGEYDILWGEVQEPNKVKEIEATDDENYFQLHIFQTFSLIVILSIFIFL